jgi:hypothetical protein
VLADDVSGSRVASSIPPNVGIHWLQIGRKAAVSMANLDGFMGDRSLWTFGCPGAFGPVWLQDIDDEWT